MNPPASRLRLVNAETTKPIPSSQTLSSLSYSAVVTGSTTNLAYLKSFPELQRPQEENESFPMLVQNIFNQSLITRSQPARATRTVQRTKELKKLSTWMPDASSQQQTAVPPSPYGQATSKGILRIEDAATEAAVFGTLLSMDPSAWDLTEMHAHGSKIEDFDEGMVINFIIIRVCTDPSLKAGDPGVIWTDESLMLFKQRFGLILQKLGNIMDIIPLYTHRAQGIGHLAPSTWIKYACLGMEGKTTSSDYDRYAPGPRLILDGHLSFDLKKNSYARVSEKYKIDFGRKTPLNGKEEVMGRLTEEPFAELKRRCGCEEVFSRRLKRAYRQRF
ncbi:uncharacterized protein BDZ99DRAFT_503969 [Mytilinidion resinicola]|uniref:Uncharacterized protein n=1 Tax=Mytilinidion resinicola TaxID=574789 RepID=A0A6A6Y2V3_9PEZI|nr:uncharacterized protein BDZ99DRAFT_503969 [Mytilinidion resinicola]KAF2802545.1 hypothetical protein BDZ99DRAFT_503969 [Mytilinidion resinicola]